MRQVRRCSGSAPISFVARLYRWTTVYKRGNHCEQNRITSGRELILEHDPGTVNQVRRDLAGHRFEGVSFPIGLLGNDSEGLRVGVRGSVCQCVIRIDGEYCSDTRTGLHDRRPTIWQKESELDPMRLPIQPPGRVQTSGRQCAALRAVIARE